MTDGTPDFDLIVIGAGMAGINAAASAAEIGARVAVVERDRVGGTCPLRGCIPSKALVRSAEVAHTVRTARRFGIAVDNISVDMTSVAARIHEIVDAGAAGALGYLRSFPTVELVTGEARFAAPGEVRVGASTLRGRRVIIATGNRPTTPEIPGLADVPRLYSDDILQLTAVPERLTVIGAGPVGLELGQAMSRLGSWVTIVETSPHLLPAAEPEIGVILGDRLAEEGIDIMLGTEILRAEVSPRGLPRLTVARGGRSRIIDGNALLVATGRAPDIESLALGNAGVDGGTRGIHVDSRLETTRPGHFAAGDVLGAPYGAFTHVARRLGRGAAGNALGHDPRDIDDDRGPTAIFTDPEVAMVGMTEERARASGHSVGVGTADFTGGRGRAWGEEHGVVKVVADRRSRRILGAHLVAYHGAELIHPVVVAMRAGSADPLINAFHIHPTFGEAVRDATEAALRDATGS